MLRNFGAVLVFTLVSCPAFAQVGPVAAGAQPFVPWANKLFQKDDAPAVIVHDFGTVPHGSLLVHKLTLTNIYDVPMQVIDVRKSCTCLEAQPPTQVLQPHESAELILTMNAAKFNGPNAQTFFITFGPQYVSTAVIRVQANSRGDVSMNPGQVNFGVVAVGSPVEQTVAIKYQGRQRDWKITEVVAPTGPFTAKLTDAVGPEFKVTVTMNADAAAGSLTEPLTLKTNDPTAPLLQIHVSAVVQAPVTVAPDKVRFEGKIGEVQTKKIILRATKAFKVMAVADDGDGISLEPFPGSSPVQIATLTFKPTLAGNTRKVLKIPTDLGIATVTIEAETKP